MIRFPGLDIARVNKTVYILLSIVQVRSLFGLNFHCVIDGRADQLTNSDILSYVHASALVGRVYINKFTSMHRCMGRGVRGVDSVSKAIRPQMQEKKLEKAQKN